MATAIKSFIVVLLLVSASAHAVPAYYTGEYNIGANKVCQYTSSRGSVHITIPAQYSCPNVIEV